MSPVYYHNYVLGHLTAAQLEDHLQARLTDGGSYFGSELAGRYPQEAVFGPEARHGREDTLVHATGERLDPRYFVRLLR